MPIRLLVALQTIPAVLFVLFALTMVREYFFLTYLIMSLIFLLASTVISGFLVRREELLMKSPGMVVFFGQLVAWLLALLSLALMNLTPLCIGQDNGDGNNNLNDCVVQTILAGGIYSIVMLMIIAVAAMIAGLLLRPRDK